MNRMIIYKEWIKTRWALLAIVVVLLGATAFTLLSLGKNVEFRGAGLLWSVLSLKDTVLIESLRYLPVFAGALLAAAQFLPETTRKRLKLTLHLPYPQGKMIAMMYGFGCCILLVLFLLQACVLGVVLNRWVVSELTVRILKTAAVWDLAGIGTYFWVSAVCLEPAWKMRSVLILLLAGLLYLLYLSSVPESYNGFFPWLALYVLGGQTLIFHSIARFKEGRQD